VRRTWRLTIAGLLLLLGLSAAGVWWELRPVGPGPSRIVAIPPGASTRQIGELLTRAGLIHRPRALVVATRLKRAGGRLRHGEYALAPTQGALEITDVLIQGRGLLHRVTIPEGFTIRQIADALAAAGVVHRERFIELATRGGRRFARPSLVGLPTDSLEGYLFPDTYHLPRSLDEEAVIGAMLDRFDAAVDATPRDAARARGLTLHQLVTIASMIEREARLAEERPVIAGVIYNRLARGMRLEIDATVLYALGRHKDRVTLADLAVESPYNTYRRDGLPPGPIASPGLAAIAAAARPAEVPYLFYVLKPDGSHHFSRTLAEHQAAVRRYQP
jgi:UPF0755 protein